MFCIRSIIVAFVVMACCTMASPGQEIKKYSKEGVAFDYLQGWDISDQAGPDIQQISLSNTATDSQILVTVLRKRSESKDAMTALKKQAIDPWLAKLIGQYTQAGVNVEQSAATAEISGQRVEGTKLKFLLDGQAGSGEAYWVLLDRRVILLYFIRPDKMAEKAAPGWDIIRKSLKVEAAKK